MPALPIRSQFIHGIHRYSTRSKTAAHLFVDIRYGCCTRTRTIGSDGGQKIDENHTLKDLSGPTHEERVTALTEKLAKLDAEREFNGPKLLLNGTEVS